MLELLWINTKAYIAHVFHFCFTFSEGWTCSVNMSSVELSFAIYLGQRLTCYSLCNFTCLAFHVSNIKSTNSKTDWLMWLLDIDLSRPTSNFYSTSNIAFTWSFDNVISKISVWHIHTFGLKWNFYGWMLFLTPHSSTVQGNWLFFRETPFLRWQSLEIVVPDKPKTKILMLQREYTVPYSVSEWTFCQKQVRHLQAVQQDLSYQSRKISHP